MGKPSKAVPFTASANSANVHSITTIRQRVLPYAIVPPDLEPTPFNEWLYCLQTPVKWTAIHTGDWRISDG